MTSDFSQSQSLFSASLPMTNDHIHAFIFVRRFFIIPIVNLTYKLPTKYIIVVNLNMIKIGLT